MDIPDAVVKAVDKYIIGPVVRRIKILENCSNNVNKLQNKVSELKADSSDRRHKLDEEEIAGQVKTETASNWFNTVREIEMEATAVHEGYQQRTCAGVWPVNCSSLYKLSKRSVQLTKRADDMLNKQFDLTKRPPPKSVIEKECKPIENQPSTQLMLEQMLDRIGDPNVGIIGVYGMGGVGKTTLVEKVNNHFIGKENESSPFNTVIMVTVSATLDIPGIRNKISKRIDLDLSNYDEDDARQKLLDALQKKKYLLILDDVWSKLELKDVGIPHPRNHKGSKILITNRSKETCTHMDADIKMKVPFLSIDESWNLFVEKAGQHVSTHPIKQFAETIVGKCDGLPLAIITVAGAMADRERVGEWADAVRQMEQPATNSLGMKEKVYHLLKFSFDRLKDNMLRRLFLYCACFPEDYDIGEYEMLNFCVEEGLVDNLGSLTAAMNHVEFLIGSLKIASMLEDGTDKRSVKIHDMMQELGQWITSSASDGNPKFLIRIGKSFPGAPHPNEWVDATRVSLIDTQTEELPQLGEKCQNLSTLLLRKNWFFRAVPRTDFFQQMNHLSILDLFGSDELYYLPNSLSHLVNLRVLRCRKCSNLRALPALGMLRKLQVLDLESCIELKQQILTFECLGDTPSNLRYLDVGNSGVSIPIRAISSSLKLVEVLKFFWARNIKWRVRSENEDRVGSGSNDLSSSEGRRVEGNNIIDVEELSHLTHLTSLSICFEHISICNWFQPLAKLMNKVELNSCTVINQDAIQALNESQNLQVLEFWNCQGLTFVPTRVEEKLLISSCNNLEKLLDGAEADQYSFQKIKLLHLIELPKLERICIGVAPLNCFGQLKRIELFSCNTLKMVFTKGMPCLFNNLSYLRIEHCGNLEVIIEAAEASAMEAEALRDALLLAIRLHLSNIVVFSDCLAVVSCFNNVGSAVDWASLSILADARRLLKFFSSVFVCHISRDFNYEAHMLASLALRSRMSQVWLSSPSPFYSPSHVFSSCGGFSTVS